MILHIMTVILSLARPWWSDGLQPDPWAMKPVTTQPATQPAELIELTQIVIYVDAKRPNIGTLVMRGGSCYRIYLFEGRSMDYNRDGTLSPADLQRYYQIGPRDHNVDGFADRNDAELWKRVPWLRRNDK